MNPLPPFEVWTPTHLEEALTLLQQGGVKVLGGGTDLLPNLKHGLLEPRALLSIRGLTELHGIDRQGGGIWIGAGSTLRDIRRNPHLRQDWPTLAQVAASVGSPLIQNSATLGGNLLLDTRCHWYNQSGLWRASVGGCLKKEGQICHVAPGLERCVAAFSADMAGPLMLMGAEVEVARATLPPMRKPVADLYGGDGRAPFLLPPGGLLTRVWVPELGAGTRVGWVKVRERAAINFGQVGVSIRMDRDPDGRVVGVEGVLTCVEPAPLRLTGLADVLVGHHPDREDILNAAEVAVGSLHPMLTGRTPSGYRLHLARLSIRDVLAHLLNIPPSAIQAASDTVLF